MSLSKSTTLFFEYPACSLLGAHTPCLDPPLHVQHRDRPPVDRTTFGLSDTSFYATIPSTTDQSPQTEYEAVDELLDDIAQLPNVPGIPTLELAAYNDTERRRLRYRLRLSVWVGHGDVSSKDYLLTHKMWKCLMEYADIYQWIDTIWHLTNRASDRAYYHVQDNLTKGYPKTEILAAEEDSWGVQWASKQRTNVLDILRSRLRQISPLFGHPIEGALDVTLPCGHRETMNEHMLVNMTVEECKAVSCPSCDARILQPEDFVELAISSEVMSSQSKYLRDHRHRAKIRHPTSNDAVNVPASMMAVALDLALESFKAPRLVNPKIFSLAECQFTQLIMARFHALFQGSERLLTQRQEDLVDALATDAIGMAKRYHMPPGYADFLLAWIAQAVIWLAERRCYECGSDHADVVHRHGGDLVYNTEAFRLANEQVRTDTGNASNARVDVDGLAAALAELNVPPDATMADVLRGLDRVRLIKDVSAW